MSCSNEVKTAEAFLSAFGVPQGGNLTAAELAGVRSYEDADFPSNEAIDVEISSLLGLYDIRPATYVTADMATDAGDPTLVGSLYEEGSEELIVSDFTQNPTEAEHLQNELEKGNWSLSKRAVEQHWYGLLSHPQLPRRVVVVAQTESQLLARSFYQATKLVANWQDLQPRP